MRYLVPAAALLLSSMGMVARNQKEQPQFEFRDSPDVKRSPVYSQAAIVHGGRLVFVSGQVGFGKDGKMPADFASQARNAFANLKSVLASAGATPKDVVKLNYLVVGLNKERLLALRAAREQFAGEDHLPASTLAGVQALAEPEIEFEVEAVAVVR